MIVNGIRLSNTDIARLKNAAKVAQSIENKWDLLLKRTIRSHADADSDRVTIGGELVPPNFEKIFIEHYFQTQIESLALAEKESELDQKIKLARAPRSIAEVMALYDKWRKGLFKPKAPLKYAADMKKRYIDAVQKTWKKYSEDFRNGGVQTQEEIKKKVREAAETTVPRAQTIVRTETTRYYNKARREYYDQGDEVTHYLFLAVRDKATTPWCSPLKQNGKRGRSGLVYAKDDPLLDKETPPVHWNCRSELLPLNRFNPTHRRLIADESIARRNNACAPLPPGWSK